MSVDAPKTDARALLEFLFRLAQAYLACGEQTAQVELTLRRAASAYGMRRSRVVAFPTVIFISINDGEQDHVNLAEGPLESLRLDQVADVYTLGAAAQRGELTPQQGLEQLNEIFRKRPRFGTLMGASLYRWTTESLGAWQLQIGRVGGYFRREKKP